MTPRRPIGVQLKRGGRESSLLPHGRLGVKKDCTDTHFFIAIWIRVNDAHLYVYSMMGCSAADSTTPLPICFK
jgi:hypothetical protein